MLSVRPESAESAQSAGDHASLHGPTAIGVCFGVAAVGVWFTGVSALWEWSPPEACVARVLGPVCVTLVCALVFRSAPLCLRVGDDALEVWTLAGPRRIPYSEISGAVPLSDRASPLYPDGITLVLRGRWPTLTALTIAEASVRNGEEAVRLITERTGLPAPARDTPWAERAARWRWAMVLHSLAMAAATGALASWALRPPGVSGAAALSAVFTGMRLGLCLFAGGAGRCKLDRYKLPLPAFVSTSVTSLELTASSGCLQA